ncbi:MAG TPA: pyridoxal-phosphate dependent enzyme [Acidobacteriota bacterium]
MQERLSDFDEHHREHVGQTLQVRARNVGRELGLPELSIKFEGGNPTGTQKDRIAFAFVKDALARGYDTITVATCGNFGCAVAHAASRAGLQSILYMPRSYTARRVQEMVGAGGKLESVDGEYEEAVYTSEKHAQAHGWYNANPGNGSAAVALPAYGTIADEIVQALGAAPAAVAVPVSNGTTLAGIFHGFSELQRRGVVERLPQMVAASSHQKNPIIKSFQEGHQRCMDLDPAVVKETRVNEPLINWHAFDGDLALAALRQSGGMAEFVSDRWMTTYARLLRELEGLDALPASTSSLRALVKLKQKGELPPGPQVAVITGRRGASALRVAGTDAVAEEH